MRRPFTRADAIAAGVSPSALRGSRFRRIFRGVYIHSSVPASTITRVEAALLVHPPDAFASHTSAAKVYGLPVPDSADVHVSVFAAADRRCRPGLTCHVAPRTAAVESRRGLRVSAPRRMFVELAGVLDLVELVVVGDALVRLGLATVEDLVEVAAGCPAATRAARLVRIEVDSPMESRLRMLIVLAGLPEPTVNHKVYDASGRLLYRFDLSYPQLKLIIEYDGRQHREDLDQWDHDIERREWFDHNGWMIVLVVARGIFQRPWETLDRIRAALKVRGCSALPRVLAEDWRPFFPGRA